MASSKPKSPKTASFKQELGRLEEIVAWFEREDVDLDASLAHFEEGLALVQSLQKRLETAKTHIEKIKLKFK